VAGVLVTPSKRQRALFEDSAACITPETCVAPSKQVKLGGFGMAAEAALDVTVTRTEPKTAELESAASRSLESSHATALPMDAKARTKVEAAEAKERARAHAKVEAERLRQERRAERKAALQEHRRQLEQRREQMATHQAQMLKEAAERQRQRAAAPAPAPLAEAAAVDAATDAPQQSTQLIPDSIEALVRQVLGSRNCPFRCLGLKPGTPTEAVRKRYLALALRLHPDKAAHPRAQEAFSALERAYSRARQARDDF